MTARKKICKDVWGIVMDFLGPAMWSINHRRSRMINQLEEFSYLLFENEKLVCDILGGKRCLQPSLCRAFDKHGPIQIFTFNLREVARMRTSDKIELTHNLPEELGCAVVSLIEIDDRIQTAPRNRRCKLTYNLHASSIYKCEIRHDGAYFE